MGMQARTRSAKWYAIVAALLLGMSPGAVAAYDWPQFGGGAEHRGNNVRETAITTGNVNQLQWLYQVSLPSVADGAPAALGTVNTAAGVKDLLFVTTRAGHILALDARTGSQVWMHQNPANSCGINGGATPCYTTSSPAVDPNRQFVYSYGLDGNVHKYRVGDGTEITSGGWPELTSAKPFNEKGSSALSIATATDGTGYLYVTNGGYPGDQGDYQGHVTAINLATGAQHVFNALCSDQTVHFVEMPGSPDCPAVQSAIWARPGTVYDPDTNRLYLSTGNGAYDPANHDWGETVFALNPDGTGSGDAPLDSYTPTNWSDLNNTDTDLGSTAPAILPVPAASKVRHLAVQGGKDQKLRLLNLDDLSGQGGPGHTGGEFGVISVPQGQGVLSTPTVWVNPADQTTWVFVTTLSGISGLQLQVDGSGMPFLHPVWPSPGSAYPAAARSSAVVANGVLFNVSSGLIQALNPTTGAQLWKDTQIGGIHWESPIIANGVLFITDDTGHLTAYALRGQVPPVALPAVVRGGSWYLRDTLSSGPADRAFAYGVSTDTALMCDWDGNGSRTPGVFRNGMWYLRNSNSTGPADTVLAFGADGDIPVCGDWDGNGTETVGVFRAGQWLLRNSTTTGGPDLSFFFGIRGDVPVVGDWDGDGRTTIGVFRDGQWFLRDRNTAGATDFSLFFGASGDVPVAGDWDGDRVVTPGVFRDGVWYLRASNSSGSPDARFAYGTSGDVPRTWK